MATPQSNPPKPDGTTPTPIPFSMSTSTIANNGLDKPNYSDLILDLSPDIFISRFTINSAHAPGQYIFNWATDKILSISGFNGVVNAPYNFIKPLFSRQVSFEAELVFIPVKVSDSRVILGGFFNYGFDSPTNDTEHPDTYSRDNFEIIVSQSLEEHIVPVPLYWLTDTVPTISEDKNVPFFAPKTQLQMYIKEAFVPNAIQPPTFEILVFLRIKFTSYGFATSSVALPVTPLNWLF